MSEATRQAFHWIVVGYVSDGAKAWIEECGGQVRELNTDPPLIAVALAYNPDGAWVWSKGRQIFRCGIEHWSTGELQEASTGITLRYGNEDESARVEYSSVETNYLILPDEEYDVVTGKVKDPRQYKVTPEFGTLGELDNQPF